MLAQRADKAISWSSSANVLHDFVGPSSVLAILSPIYRFPSFLLVLVPSVADEPSVNHALAKFCDHSIDPHSSIGASFVGWVSSLDSLSYFLSAEDTLCYHILVMKELKKVPIIL